jgi:hypothetical protein
MIITPPMRGSITFSNRASFISSCPTTWVKGNTLRLLLTLTDQERTAQPAIVSQPQALLLLAQHSLARQGGQPAPATMEQGHHPATG